MSLTNISCGNCGVAFCLPTPMYHARVQDGGDFSCPNGHVISYRPSGEQKRIKALEEEVRFANRRIERDGRAFDEVYATRESLIAAIKECPGGCGWHSRKQVPRDAVAMGRGLERVRLDVAEHLVRVHGAQASPVRELEAGV
jgi:hypothetical protein